MSQREETKAAKDTLKQANSEIKQVVLATKVLLDDWKKTLQAMQHRDKALQSMNDLINDKREAISNLETEIQGIMKEIAVEQMTNSRLIDTEDKFKKEG